MVGRAKLVEESDAQLLRRVVDGRDERAFACLVSRHAKVVLGACYRVLRNRQDAEDAFQAVILTMATKSRSLKNVRSLSAWLHGVSVRTSLNLHRMNRKWQRAVENGHETAKETYEDNNQADALSHWLDEELARLPDRYREVLILCDMEEYTRQEAARQLRILPGTVASRLARGRKLLRTALERRGITIAIGGAACTLSQLARSAPAASPELIQETVRSARSLAAGSTLMLATSERVATLVHEVKKTMMLAKLKTVSSLCILAVAIATGAPAVTSSIGWSDSTARAETIFFDDFEDGSATNDAPLMADGRPVTWRTRGPGFTTTYEVSNGDLRVSNSQFDRSGVLGPADNLGNLLVLDDTSIRAQVRLEAVAGQGVGLAARGDAVTGDGYWAFIVAEGDVWVYRGTGESELAVETNLRPTEEDLLLQLDVMGDMIEFWAWRVGEPMPAEPLLTRVGAGLSSGSVAVLYTNSVLPQPNGTAAFRWVHVSTTHIPEPSTATLCGIGMLAVLGIRRWPQLSRP